MATFKNNLTAAEATPDITCEKVMALSVTITNGRCHVSVQKCDGSGNVLKDGGGNFVLSSGDLTSIMNIVMPAARAAGVLQAGTTVEE